MIIVKGLAVSLYGMAAGLVYSLLGLGRKLSSSLILKFVVDLLSTLIAGLLFIVAIFTLFDGQIAFFEAICFCFGLIFEQIFVYNLFALTFKKICNILKSRRKTNDTSKVDKPC